MSVAGVIKSGDVAGLRALLAKNTTQIRHELVHDSLAPLLLHAKNYSSTSQVENLPIETKKDHETNSTALPEIVAVLLNAWYGEAELALKQISDREQTLLKLQQKKKFAQSLQTLEEPHMNSD